MVMVSCSICGAPIEAPDSLKGATTQCPQCGAPNEVQDDEDWFNEYVASPTDRALEQAQEIQRAESYRRHSERAAAKKSDQTLAVLYGIYWLLAALVGFVMFQFDPLFGLIAGCVFILVAIVKAILPKSNPRR